VTQWHRYENVAEFNHKTLAFLQRHTGASGRLAS
jgi:hypothetical protein